MQEHTPDVGAETQTPGRTGFPRLQQQQHHHTQHNHHASPPHSGTCHTHGDGHRTLTGTLTPLATSRRYSSTPLLGCARRQTSAAFQLVNPLSAKPPFSLSLYTNVLLRRVLCFDFTGGGRTLSNPFSLWNHARCFSSSPSEPADVGVRVLHDEDAGRALTATTVRCALDVPPVCVMVGLLPPPSVSGAPVKTKTMAVVPWLPSRLPGQGERLGRRFGARGVARDREATNQVSATSHTPQSLAACTHRKT